MQDKLITPGGILSLGLSQSPHGLPGVHWSLSLSHMRHYGLAVSSVGLLDVNPKRLTFGQLQVATVGSILGLWRVSPALSTCWIQILQQVGMLLRMTAKGRKIDLWIDMLVEGTTLYLEAKGSAKEVAMTLINLGRKRSTDFIPTVVNGRQQVWPFFRLRECDSILKCLKGPLERIKLLRHIAARIPQLSEVSTIIRVYPDNQIPRLKTRSKHAVANQSHESYGDSSAGVANQNKLSRKPLACYATTVPGFPRFLDQTFKAPSLSHHRWTPKVSAEPLDTLEELHNVRRLSPIKGNRMSLSIGDTELQFLIGDPDSAAIYASTQEMTALGVQHSMDQLVLNDDIAWCLQNEFFSQKKLKALIKEQGKTIYRTLVLLSFAKLVYQTLPDTTITTKVLTRPFVNSGLAQYVFRRHETVIPSMKESDITMGRLYSLENALWLISYFEGAHNIPLNHLDCAMAISVADSIYFSKRVSTNLQNMLHLSLEINGLSSWSAIHWSDHQATNFNIFSVMLGSRA